ncbi:hypothetical protein NUW58_g10661 [Xylaria curta]|uniref:Uncharacterized protein n=1 Tax=Xylaria curta TaxID=42375 RepID=A0ACC1MIR9_9PEZI|nr:hypothetical protein NUW58_g10661 [Xylaria curta]
MASDRTRCSRHCTPFLVAIAFFILSIVSFKYTWPSQIHPSLSSHPTSDAYSIDEAMDATKKHDKNGIEMTYPKISTLPASLLPTYPSIPRRLIIIGDVHGHLKSLEALLRKAEVSTSRGDTVIFAGDMVNKGPDSAGVVELAMQIGAFGATRARGRGW